MKRILVATALLLICMTLMGCEQSPKEKAEAASRDSVETEYAQSDLRSRFSYVHDERTNPHTCFAIYETGGNGRGPTMVQVDCNTLPAGLAFIIKPATR